MVFQKPLKKAVHAVCTAFFICLTLCSFSCSSEPEMAAEDWYFAGLAAKEKGDAQLAVSLFTKGKKQGNALLAPLCQAELLQLVTDKALLKEQKYAKKYFSSYPAVEQLLYPPVDTKPTVGTQSQWDARIQKALDYVKEGNYNRAYDFLDSVMPFDGSKDCSQFLSQFEADELSLIGRILLYGYGSKLSRAQILAEYAEMISQLQVINQSGSERLFILQFYAGRLYSYSGRQYYGTAVEWFQQAMNTAASPERYDNALWYLLDTRRKQSISLAVTAVKQYGTTWNDPSYFDDFLEDLCADICVAGQWDLLYQVLQSVESTMSETVLVQYRYICGRAMETNLISSVPVNQRLEKAEELLQAAWNVHAGSMYYRMLLAERLNKKLFSAGRQDNASGVVQQHDLLLNGYVRFGFYDRILPLCLEYGGTFESGLLKESLSKLSDTATEHPEWSSLALRAASYATGWSESNSAFELQFLPYVYPRYYQYEVTKAASEFMLDANLLFGLIRSESYFDAAVKSHAGAIGLSQLMTTTAGDVAHKLKVSDYDLTDPEVNARFGAFYLAEQISRLDGDILLAAMSYNAGRTNVRNWRKKMPDLPHDLFLEAVPFKETRGYGRKITTAYGVYAMLYDNATTHEIVQKLLR